MIKAILFCLIYLFFILLFLWIRQESLIRNVIHYTYAAMGSKARRRSRERKLRLLKMQEESGYFFRMEQKLEQKLIYSGLAVRFPLLTPELWMIGNLLAGAGLYLVVTLWGKSLWTAMGALVFFFLGERLVLNILMSRQYRRVNEELMKFLDFLGNYSITAGEVTGVLNQISRYMKDPLKRVLDECYYEAQTSGDASIALLAMAEKIEHPAFKDLIRNIEVSGRYAADFTVLVADSRRALRDHLRSRQERKGMLQEAMINMSLLAIMSLAILYAVQNMTGIPVRSMLWDNWAGKVGISVIAAIFLMMYGQIRSLDG